jgi:hypothetical protein
MKSSFFLNCFFIVAFFFTKAQPSFLWAKNIGSGNDMGYSIAVDASNNVYTTGYFTGTADFDPGPGVFTLTSNGGQDVFISKLDQSGNFVWAKSIGSPTNDIGTAVSVSTVDGGVYVTGVVNGPTDFDPGAGTYTLNYGPGSDFFVLKLDASGNFVWAHGFDNSGEDAANSINIDSFDNILIGGYFSGTVDFDPGGGITSASSVSLSTDAFILQLTSSGNFNWVKTFGGEDVDRIYSTTLDQTGNIYSTGTFAWIADFDPGAGTSTLSSFGSQSSIFITKFDPSGNFIWAKTFIGAGFDYGLRIVVDQSGNVYSTGIFGNTTDFDPGPGTFTYAANSSQSCFISKLDASGNFVWAKSMNNYGAGWALSLDPANQLYIGGTFNGTVDLDPGPGTQTASSAGFADIFILKLDQGGSLLWAGVMPGNGNDNIKCSTIDQAGNIYTTGAFYGTSDFDPNIGVSNLTYTIGGSVFVQKLSPMPAGIENTLLSKNEISIYPIPTNDILYLTNLNKNGFYVLLNSVGETVLKGNTVAELNLSHIAKGIYFLRITSDSSQKTFKIIKE